MKKLILILALVFIFSCQSDKDNSPKEYDFEIIEPLSGEIISNRLNFAIVSEFERPDCIDVYIDANKYHFDCADFDYPLCFGIDISEFSDGSYTMLCSLRWDAEKIGKSVDIGISNITCANSPVILNGIEIEEEKIQRDSNDCPQVLWLNDMEIDDPECLENIGSYGSSIEEIYLFHNDLEAIDLSYLDGCYRLRKLHLWGNRLETVDLSPLASLPRLREIDFGGSNNDLHTRMPFGNNISEIDLSPLAKLDMLRFLDLSYNDLGYVDLSPISDRLYLAELYISDNNLTHLLCETFPPENNIGKFDISNNEIEQFDFSVFRYCNHLRILRLFGNSFGDIDLSYLGTSYSLETINLSDNGLSEINLDFLIHSNSIENLIINDCQLNSIDLSPLSACFDLQRLELGNNYISNIDIAPLADKDRLYWLDLKNNSLTEFDILPLFDNESAQIYIFLQGNDISGSSCTYICGFAAAENREVIADCDCMDGFVYTDE